MKLYKTWRIPDSDFEYKLDPKNRYQAKQRRITLEHCSKFRTVIDIGAHIGFWAKDFCKKFERVICFEPNKDVIKCLKQNLRTFSNFEIINCALGQEKCRGKVVQGFALTTSCRIEQGNEIDIRPLDDFKFENVDLIKLDVESFEFSVLMGGKQTILKNKPIIVL